MGRIVYSPEYNISFGGLEKLHPFDARKFERVWNQLLLEVDNLDELRVAPDNPVSEQDLAHVHTARHLRRMHESGYVAEALELPPLRYLPHALIDRSVLRPMRWASQGTVVASRECLQHGFAVNLGGGFHHAKPTGGEGFCVYTDIALAIQRLRSESRLPDDKQILYVDLDAHQGNGVCHSFLEDPQVRIFDMYNAQIYPFLDTPARDRIDYGVQLQNRCSSTRYLNELTEHLPKFLDQSTQPSPVGLAIYNAGTDIHKDDPLGALGVSTEAILERDLFVVNLLRAQNIPTVMLLSGGYTRISWRLVATSVRELLRRH